MRRIARICGTLVHGREVPNKTTLAAFTLIELLIVVAIIAILAAIAVPNFLEAQTRSRVARVKADVRSIRTALEAYRLDNNQYPSDQAPTIHYAYLVPLTTPVAYITTVPPDPFASKMHRVATEPDYYEYAADPGNEWPPEMVNANIRYWLCSPGPDLDFDLQDYGPWGRDDRYWPVMDAGTGCLEVFYDSTNGTKSSGDLLASNKRMCN